MYSVNGGYKRVVNDFGVALEFSYALGHSYSQTVAVVRICRGDDSPYVAASGLTRALNAAKLNYTSDLPTTTSHNDNTPPHSSGRCRI